MEIELPTPPKVGMVSLGCPKNLVDSERILTKLRSDGYQMSPDYAGADVVLVNTCGFLDSAKEESLEAIGEAIAENGRVIVTGCMGKEADLIRERFPEVRWIRLERNVGYAAANNLGLEAARGRYVCWLNSDAELLKDTLASTLAFLDQHHKVGAASPMNVGPDGASQPSVSPEHAPSTAKAKHRRRRITKHGPPAARSPVPPSP